MISAIALLATGAFLALYFSHTGFQSKIDDLAASLIDIFTPASKNKEAIPGVDALPPAVPVPPAEPPKA